MAGPHPAQQGPRDDESPRPSGPGALGRAYPRRDSNPRYRRERAASWAARRRGRAVVREEPGFLAGVPGLEPRLTEPESVGLPITPYPKGDAAPRGARERRYPTPRGQVSPPPGAAPTRGTRRSTAAVSVSGRRIRRERATSHT